MLYASLGGTTYSWWSGPMILLLVLAIGLSVAFVLAERRAREPLVPLRLFRIRVFSVASAIGFVIGMALFGAVTYIPLYLQVVKGASPTASGLQLLPLMGGLLVASIGSGQLIVRFGRYKIFPIVGTGLAVVGMLLLSRLGTGTSLVLADLYLAVLGLGLGFTMQVLVLAVQNAVSYENLGVATSTATLFRSMGGTIGVPVFGAIFANHLAKNLRQSAAPRGPGEAPVADRPGPDRRAAAGDPRSLHRRVGRGAPADLPDRRGDRGARVHPDVVPRRASAARHGGRPGDRRHLRRATRRHLPRRSSRPG